MSGPFQPAINELIRRLPIGQTQKPRGDDRPAGVLPPGQSNEPVMRSEYAKRILAARRAGVDPSQITQPPGYRGKGDSLIPPSAPPKAAAPPVRAPAPQVRVQDLPPPQAPAPRAPVPSPPVVKPPVAPPPVAPPPMAAPPVQPESVRRAAAMDQAFKLAQSGAMPPNLSMNGWGSAPPPTTATSPVWQGGAKPIPGMLPPQPQVREATPDEIRTAQKGDMAANIAKSRSGGEGQPPRGATPPVPPVTPPTSPPPPRQETFKPITAPTSEYIVRDPAAEKQREKEKNKPQKSTYRQMAVPNQSYYDILKVPRGDNRLASQAITKLRKDVESGNHIPTREEDRLLAAENPAYPKQMDEESIRGRFAEYERKGGGSTEKEETERPAFSKDAGPPVKSSNVQVRGQNTYAARVPMKTGRDPAEKMAEIAIDEAGAPAWQGKSKPTQEDVNQKKKNPEAYKKRFESADVDTDRAVQNLEED